jgi:hypothetical protein
LPANVAKPTVSPDTTSGKWKSAAGVPSAGMVDSVCDMADP